MVALGNLTAKIGDNQTLFCPTLKQFNFNLFQEWRFPLRNMLTNSKVHAGKNDLSKS